jgi:hypothetical protein
VGWALDRLCELDGARWVYDSDQLGAIRRDVMNYPDPPRREPPGRDGALRPHAPRPRSGVIASRSGAVHLPTECSKRSGQAVLFGVVCRHLLGGPVYVAVNFPSESSTRRFISSRKYSYSAWP